MFQRKQFTFYRSFYEGMLLLPVERRLDAYEAVIRYALDGELPEGLDNMQYMAFKLIKPVLDAAWVKAMNGQIGGSKPKAKRKQKESKGEIEKENEIEIENEIENELEDERLWRARFERFWDLYPVKIAKEKAWEVYLRIKPDDKKLCYAVSQWVRSSQWMEDQGRFVPKPEKFLEEGQFDHLPGDVVPMGASGELGEAEIQAIRRIMEQ